MKMLSTNRFRELLVQAASEDPVVGTATEVGKRFGVSCKHVSRYMAAIADELITEGFICGKTSTRLFVVARAETGIDRVFKLHPCEPTPKQQSFDEASDKYSAEYPTDVAEAAGFADVMIEQMHVLPTVAARFEALRAAVLSSRDAAAFWTSVPSITVELALEKAKALQQARETQARYAATIAELEA